MSEEKKQAELYDQFVSYVQRHMRDSDNNNLSVKEFDLREINAYDMQLVLENVDHGTKKLFDAVERFKPGARLETRESVGDGAPVFVATIPYKRATNSRSSKVKKRRVAVATTSAPRSGLLMFYVFSMMSLVVVAALKTTRDEWSFLF